MTKHSQTLKEYFYGRVYRFDDVSVNSNRDHTLAILDTFDTFDKTMHCYLMAVSPLVSSASTAVDKGRVFPPIFGAYSDHSIFYRMQRLGLPELIDRRDVLYASHGLIHVDHRLLSYDAQEMSIVTSCHLVDSDIFVPPFNKWNEDTVKICDKHQIQLIKWEQGWKCIEHNLDRSPSATHSWYLHDRELTTKQLADWLTQ